MNIQETLQLLEALKKAGATHFKNPELEVTLSPNGSTTTVYSPTYSPLQVAPSAFAQADQAPVDPAVQAAQDKAIADANVKLKAMMDTINMDPTQLANYIFPQGAE
jgi:hypothetical protein